MAVKEYFHWIEESSPDGSYAASDTSSGAQSDVTICGVTILWDGTFAEREESLIEAGRRLIQDGHYEQGMQVDGRPMSNLEMSAIICYSNWSVDANAAEWWKQLIEWIGGIDVNATR